MKRVFAFFFCALLAGQVWAQTFTVGNLKYSVIEGTTNVLVAKGSAGPTGALIIPDKVTNPNNNVEYTVTSIGEHAFGGISGIWFITIPSTVKSIGDYAFFECIDLREINIPNSVTSIGSNAA